MNYDEMDDTQLKNWLFKENMRLEDMRSEVSRASRMLREQAELAKIEEQRLADEKLRFQAEKEEFKSQMHDWTGKIREERKKLEEEQSFFDKKFKILEMGFKQLEADRKSFEAKKRAFEYRKYEQENFKQSESEQSREYGHDYDSRYNSDPFEAFDADPITGDSVFFRGVTHPLALKKRYKDLIKIYHPDNLAGDKTVLQQINKEYDRLKKSINYQKKA